MKIRCLLGSLIIVLLCVATSGCSSVGQGSMVRMGPGISIVAKELTDNTSNQTVVLGQLKIRSGLSNKSDLKAADWDLVIKAGIEYSDLSCENYLALLDRVNRDKKSAVSQIGLVGTAAASLMAAAQSSAREVSSVAVLFGLAAATAENLGGNLLYDLDPASVRVMVKTLQARYKDALGVGAFSSRPEAFAAIQEYAALCTPANIEAEVNVLIKQANPNVSKSPGNGIAPRVSNVIITSNESFRPDENSALIRNYAEPKGVLDLVKVKQIDDFLHGRGLTDHYATFLYAEKYASLRKQYIEQFHLVK